MAGIDANSIGDYAHSEGVGSVEEPEVSQEAKVQEAGAETEVETVPDAQEPENPWDVEHLKGEDGLVAGKYKNIDALIKSLEHSQSKLAELQGEKQSETAKANNAEKADVRATEVHAVEDAGVKAYLEGGRNMTAEMVAEIEAGGGNATSVELKAIKAGQHIDKMTALVGGEDTFYQMITEMAEGKTDAQKEAWLRTINDPSLSEYAVKGLHAEWLDKTGQRAPVKNGRFAGKAANVGSVKPFNSQGEVLAAAARARKDSGFRAEYEARKNMTPDGILFNRK